jgi:hypothetical protein
MERLQRLFQGLPGMGGGGPGPDGPVGDAANNVTTINQCRVEESEAEHLLLQRDCGHGDFFEAGQAILTTLGTTSIQLKQNTRNHVNVLPLTWPDASAYALSFVIPALEELRAQLMRGVDEEEDAHNVTILR